MHKNLANAVSGFAKTMGLNDLQLPDSGIIKFSFEETGVFFIEDQEEGTAFYLLREQPEYVVNSRIKKAFYLCHYKRSHSFDVQSALHEQSNLIFLTRVTHEKITLPVIEEILRHLVGLHEKIEAEELTN